MIGTIWGLPLAPLLVLVVTVFAAGFVQATAGFGFSLLAVPLMSLVIAPEIAVVTVFLHGACSSTLTARRHRAHVEWAEARRLSLGAVVAMPLGVVVLITTPGDALRLALGLFTCAAAIFMLLPSTKRRGPFRPRPYVTYGVGAVSGLLNTSTSTNGPPLVVYLQARGLDVTAFRSTISTVFAVSSIVGFFMLAIGGAVHLISCKYFVLTLVPALCGWLLGNATAARLRGELFSRLVDGLLLTSGLLLMGKVLLG